MGYLFKLFFKKRIMEAHWKKYQETFNIQHFPAFNIQEEKSSKPAIQSDPFVQQSKVETVFSTLFAPLKHNGKS